jgi:hypothetical protein
MGEFHDKKATFSLRSTESKVAVCIAGAFCAAASCSALRWPRLTLSHWQAGMSSAS